jgi:dihydrofolate reductase
VFREALPLAGRVYLTRVHGRPKGDVVLDAFDPQVWRETAREPMQQGAGDQYSADFIVLDRQH